MTRVTPRRSIPALFLISCALSGCAALDGFERSLEEAGWARFSAGPRCAGLVRVSAAPESGRGGCGAVLGPRTVLTVAHVLGDATAGWVCVERDAGWRLARVIRTLPSTPEDLLVLELEPDQGPAANLFGWTGFDVERWLLPAPGASPARVGAPSGTWRWGTALAPGDSGSPVLSSDGELVGLVSGRIGDRPVLAALPAAFGPVELAHNGSR